MEVEHLLTIAGIAIAALAPLVYKIIRNDTEIQGLKDQMKHNTKRDDEFRDEVSGMKDRQFELLSDLKVSIEGLNGTLGGFRESLHHFDNTLKRHDKLIQAQGEKIDQLQGGK